MFHVNKAVTVSTSGRANTDSSYKNNDEVFAEAGDDNEAIFGGEDNEEASEERDGEVTACTIMKCHLHFQHSGEIEFVPFSSSNRPDS